MNKLKHKIDSGRSMVEMLGTLAIIGVLSVGGIAGYSYGMDRYYANEIVKGLTLRAIDMKSQVERCTSDVCEVSIEAWENDQTPLPISLSNGGLLQVNNVPSRVCRMIKDMLEGTATVFIENNDDANIGSEACYAKNEVPMWFVFDPEILSNLENNGEFTTPVIMTTETTVTAGPPLPCMGDTPLVDSNGNCYPCNTPLEIVSPNCHVCENRYEEGGMCVRLPLPTAPVVSTEPDISEVTEPDISEATEHTDNLETTTPSLETTTP
jgi:hypothetical protein